MRDTLRLNKPVDPAKIQPKDDKRTRTGKGPGIPKPAPGLVICYSYLWHREQKEGREEGIKNRPCVVVAVLPAKQEGAKPDVMVAPITHTRPLEQTDWDSVIEIPAAQKQKLGLDELPSYVCCNEVNRFTWPGEDLRHIPNGKAYTFGLMEKDLFEQIRTRVLDIRGQIVRRHLIADAPENAA